MLIYKFTVMFVGFTRICLDHLMALGLLAQLFIHMLLAGII